MSNIERQESSSSSSEDGDETTAAKGGVTTVTSLRRLANTMHSPIHNSPKVHCVAKCVMPTYVPSIHPSSLTSSWYCDVTSMR